MEPSVSTVQEGESGTMAVIGTLPCTRESSDLAGGARVCAGDCPCGDWCSGVGMKRDSSNFDPVVLGCTSAGVLPSPMLPSRTCTLTLLTE
eukprot:CAMPEP_0172087234 /NCGR_PEP_ID=MMETSP1043-20130122/22567_1 /TAXON_ID=464988 /ORGANISM="Hemiselmis andersenii, Strain CCMP441" /LENGTH=90 /DNA_ID=CAMNT_0012749409 /DNA_START=226 /DNA_END=495 /DNA_ORIENTATION=+